MQFVYPQMLWGLLALAIPIIIHLFYFRRYKKIYFTNVHLLKEIKEETSTRSNLKHLLVLLARLGAIAAIILAFAQPFLSGDEKVTTGAQAVSIYIDNSFSMSAAGMEASLLDQSKQRAREIVDGYGRDDQFQIITNSFSGEQMRLIDQEQAIEYIRTIESSPAVRTLSEVLNRQKQTLIRSESSHRSSYLLTDLQKNITDLSKWQDTTMEVSIFPFQATRLHNIGIDSCWFGSPVQVLNQSNPLIVKIRNYGEEDEENVRISLSHEGQSRPFGTLSIPAGESVLDTLNLTLLKSGWHPFEVSISDYPIQFDDIWYGAFHVDEQLQILTLHDQDDANPYLRASFNQSDYIEQTFTPVSRINYGALSQQDLILLDDLDNISSGMSSSLKRYLENGGNVLIFPGEHSELESYNRFFRSIGASPITKYREREQQVGWINDQAFVFQDVFAEKPEMMILPKTKGSFGIQSIQRYAMEPIMRYRDRSVYMASYPVQQGHLYLSTAPLNTELNQLVRNGEIFIPMLYRMAISSSSNEQLSYTIGQDQTIEVQRKPEQAEIVYRFEGPSNFIPSLYSQGAQALLNIEDQISEAGFYHLYLGEEKTGIYAFNYDRTESAMDFTTKESLPERVRSSYNWLDEIATGGKLTETVRARSEGIPLWRWFIILSIVFLGLEQMLLRLWKV